MAEALDALLPADERSGDLTADLAEAARRSMQRRLDTTRHGGAVIGELYRQVNSWRKVEAMTGISTATARRWSAPPGGES